MTMANYEKTKAFILSWEGGFSNHKNDKGGATNKGVSWSVWAEYARRKGFTPTVSNLKAMTDEQWDEIFTRNYWAPINASKIEDESIAALVVDWAYCSGVSTAAKNVQRYLGVKVDGVIGPVTLKKLNHPTIKASTIFNDIKDRRVAFLQNIVKRNPSQKVFLNGWMNRLNHINYGDIKENK